MSHEGPQLSSPRVSFLLSCLGFCFSFLFSVIKWSSLRKWLLASMEASGFVNEVDVLESPL